MIFDLVQNMSKYSSIPRLKDILAFIKNTDLKGLSEGDHFIDGEDLYVKALSYVPTLSQENNFETHALYTDVQVVVEGVELMQVAPSDCLHKKTDCEMEGDFEFFSASEFISDLIVRQGQFAVFYSGEAHKPGCLCPENSKIVKKLVFKVK